MLSLIVVRLAVNVASVFPFGVCQLFPDVHFTTPFCVILDWYDMLLSASDVFAGLGAFAVYVMVVGCAVFIIMFASVSSGAILSILISFFCVLVSVTGVFLSSVTHACISYIPFLLNVISCCGFVICMFVCSCIVCPFVLFIILYPYFVAAVMFASAVSIILNFIAPLYQFSVLLYVFPVSGCTSMFGFSSFPSVCIILVLFAVCPAGSSAVMFIVYLVFGFSSVMFVFPV